MKKEEELLRKAIYDDQYESVVSLLKNAAASNKPFNFYLGDIVGLCSSPGILRVLLDHGLKIDKDSLSYAVTHHYPPGIDNVGLFKYNYNYHNKTRLETVILLLDAGADVNSRIYSTKFKAWHGQTVLMYAASFGYTDVVKELLARGADRALKTVEGDTALTLIQKGKYYKFPFWPVEKNEIIALLENFGPSNHYRLTNIGFDSTKLEKDDLAIYESIIDPISLKIIDDPIVLSNGQTYDRASLKTWFEHCIDPDTNKILEVVPCPMTQEKINRNELKNKTCVFIKGIIERFIYKQENTCEKSLKRTRIESNNFVSVSDVSMFSECHPTTTSNEDTNNSENANNSLNKKIKF